MINCNIVLFDGFETLDAFGPAEIISMMPDLYHLEYYSYHGGVVTSTQNIRVETLPFRELREGGILLIPGGIGTRKLVDDVAFIAEVKKAADSAAFVLTVCTGAALLAKTGLLDGRRATSNKRVFDWVCSVRDAVVWIRQARWVVEGKFYTASGVSAGMDMTLGFVFDQHGAAAAREVADAIEYTWNSDREIDPFA